VRHAEAVDLDAPVATKPAAAAPAAPSAAGPDDEDDSISYFANLAADE
jgi:hypothetical protein